MFTTFAAFPESIMVSRFADIVSVEQFIEDQENENTKKKTQQNVALLKEFLTLKNESRRMEEIPPKKLNAYFSEFIITVRKKDNNEDFEPSSLRSLMASFEEFNISVKSLNQSPTLTSPETEMKSTTRYKRVKVFDSDSE